MTKTKKSLVKFLIRQLRVWHRKLGILTAIFLIFLAATGMMINHANFLSLDSTPVTNNGLLNFYGIKTPTDMRFYDNGQIAVTDNFVWLNDKLLLESSEPIIGAAKFQSMWLVVTSERLYLYTTAGELIDQLGTASGVPEHISAISINNQEITVKSENKLLKTDGDFLTWQSIKPSQAIVWLSPYKFTDININKKQQVLLQFKSQFLNWEQVLLDVHSGRIFGDIGVLVSDVIAILLILLSLSGLYIWIRYTKNKR